MRQLETGELNALEAIEALLSDCFALPILRFRPPPFFQRLCQQLAGARKKCAGGMGHDAKGSVGGYTWAAYGKIHTFENSDTMYIKMYISNKTMKNRHSIADARRNLPTIIREVENGKEVELTRRGEPVAMLISAKTFRQLKSTQGGFATAYRKFRETANLIDLNLNPDELFSDVREETGGREIHF